VDDLSRAHIALERLSPREHAVLPPGEVGKERVDSFIGPAVVHVVSHGPMKSQG
jgi:hypothetical protein